MRSLVGLLFMLAVTLAFSADVIPEANRITWQGNVGIDGGIPTYAVHDTLTAIDNTGATDVTAAIQSALNSAPNDTAIVLPAGTFKLSSQLSISSDNVLRGSGIDSTVLTVTASHAIAFYAYQAWTTTPRTVSADINKGDTSFTLSSAPTETIGVGMKVKLYENNDSDLVAGLENAAHTKSRTQWVEITAVSGTTYEFTPPAYTNYNTADSASVTFTWLSGSPNENFKNWAGIEDMTITNSNASSASIVQFGFASNCWMRNVKTINGGVSHVAPWDSYRCEIRDCWFSGILPPITSSRGYCIQFGTPNTPNTPASTSALLMEGCIVEGTRGGVILGYGSSGNVIGYNYFVDIVDEVATIQKPDISIHSSFPTQNLIEGNFCTRMYADMYHGNAHYNHFVRNWAKGADSSQNKESALTSVEIDYQHRNYTVAGNVLGYSGITSYVSGLGSPGTSFYEEYVPNAASSYGKSYRAFMLGYNSEAGGTSNADTEVRNTLLRKGNYNYVDGAIPAGEALGVDTIADSYYLTSSPPHVVDPTNPSMEDTDLPAGNWYINGAVGSPPAQIKRKTSPRQIRGILAR